MAQRGTDFCLRAREKRCRLRHGHSFYRCHRACPLRPAHGRYWRMAVPGADRQVDYQRLLGGEMKKLILAVLALVMLLPSSAFPANSFEEKNHKNWKSIIVQDEYGSFMRMVTSGGNGTFLSIDFYPNYNSPQESYSICVLLYDESLGDINKNIQITGNIRIDKKNIYDVICTIKTDTNIIYNYIKGNLSPYIFKDAIEGNTLRIKFNFDNPTIFKFSLLGFTEAFNRCMQMISIMRNEYNEDEEYFKK